MANFDYLARQVLGAYAPRSALRVLTSLLLASKNPRRSRSANACTPFFRAAKEAGVAIEHGPGRHGIGGAMFLYMLEPGGNRIELMGDPGYMIFDPSWRTVVWKGSEVPTIGAVWTGSPVPDSFLNYGTPAAEERQATPKAAAA